MFIQCRDMPRGQDHSSKHVYRYCKRLLIDWCTLFNLVQFFKEYAWNVIIWWAWNTFLCMHASTPIPWKVHEQVHVPACIVKFVQVIISVGILYTTHFLSLCTILNRNSSQLLGNMNSSVLLSVFRGNPWQAGSEKI